MDKWEYITKISHASDKTGNLLIELMDANNVNNLASITTDQAKEFYERRILDDNFKKKI